MKKGIHGLLLLALAVSSGFAQSEVLQKSDSEFVIRLERLLDHNSQTVYRGLAELPAWWNPSHSHSGEAANLSFELQAGGCFCERWGQSSVEHLRVIYAVDGREVRLEGGLGPLQTMPVNGLMRWRLVPQGEKTALTWEYSVWGNASSQLERLADPVSDVLAEQVQGLADYLNREGSD